MTREVVDRGYGAFDELRPPSAEMVEDCVHCGFCLPACPTYALWGQEMDSPRGRIHLIKIGLDGEATLDRKFVQHFDRCLGCMACVTACPSGVKYEPLLEATRAQIERRAHRSPSDRAYRGLLVRVLSNRQLLRFAVLGSWLYKRLRISRALAALGILGRLPARWRAIDALLPDVSVPDAWARLPERTAGHATRLRVGFLSGCVQSVFFHRINVATVNVLVAEGCEVIIPGDAGCCGALAAHAGAEEQARQLAKDLIVVFESYELDRIVVNAAGCGANLCHYERLFTDDPEWRERAARLSGKICDVMELLDELEPRAQRHPITAKRVAYHDACHLPHAQGIRTGPRRVLGTIPDLEVVEVPDGDMCCGSAGIYNLTQPDAARELGERKAENIRAIEPEVVAAGNPGCLLQLRQYLTSGTGSEANGDIRLVHPIELIAESIGK